MLVYRGMDIGTAKPTPAERNGVRPPPDRHPRRTPDRDRRRVPAAGAGRHRGLPPPRCRPDRGRRVRAVCPGDRRRLRVPGDRPSPARPARAAAGRGRTRDDAPAAPRGRPVRRRRRSCPGTGGGSSARWRWWSSPGRPYGPTLPAHRYRLPDVVQIGLDIDRPVLDARIAARVDAMWTAGLVAEVAALAVARAAPGTHGVPCPRLPAGVGVPRRRPAPSRRPRPRRSPRRAASPGGRTRGSARTHGSHWLRVGCARPARSRVHAVRVVRDRR